MEIYTDFAVSYLIQTFVNKIDTKLWNDCRSIPLPSNFKFSERTFYILWKEQKNIVQIEAAVLTL